MLRAFRIGFMLLLLATAEAYSQNDSTRYINGLPVTEDDTARQFLQTDLDPKNNLSPVAFEALPSRLRKTLDGEEQYSGWRDSVVYYDRNTRLYIIHVRSEEGVKIFGLNDDGRPVTFSQVKPRP